MRSLIANGKDTYFWLDRWVGEVHLITLVVEEVDLTEKYRRVSDYWELDLGWRWAAFDSKLLKEALERIATIMLAEEPHLTYGFYWRASSDGNFSIRIAYGLSLTSLLYESKPVWKKLWKLHVPHRVRSFLWLVMHGRVMTNLERARRGFTIDAGCGICSDGIETIDHLLRTYPNVAGLWEYLLHPDEIILQCPMSMEAWLIRNLGGK